MKNKKIQIKKIIEDIFIMGIPIILVLVINKCLIFNARVPSSSMENTILTGDRVIGNRKAYNKENLPQRGDIIIFYAPDNEKIVYVKRIIGIPRDKIEINNGVIYLNGNLLEEAYIKEEMNKDNKQYYFEVPEDSYFCLGDNRNNSLDARFWKNTYVTKDKIIAKVKYNYLHNGVFCWRKIK